MKLPARIRRAAAGTPLRVRLVASVVAIAVVGLAVAGLATITSLRSYLVGRVDTDISHFGNNPGFAQTGAFGGGQPGAMGDPESTGLGGRGPTGQNPFAGSGRGALPSNFFLAVYAANGQRIKLLRSSEPSGMPRLPSITSTSAGGLIGQPFTSDSLSGGGDWRVLVSALPNGQSLVVAESLDGVDATLHRLILLEILIGMAVLLLMSGGGYLVVRRSLRPLTEVERTAAAIADGDLSSRVPEADERTEVGRLAAALNSMLSQIETAFAHQHSSEQEARATAAKMRRFVGDASHELRTPLTSIRGFAELYRMGAASDAADVRRLMSRIESESARMGGLVEDLLLLARLDEARPLHEAPVDVTEIATDAVHDASLIASGRQISLRFNESVTVVGDEAKLRQVLHNLLNNALSHTPTSSPVTVRVNQDGDWAVIEVIDRGPGIAPDHAAHVFERFYRTDSARSRADGGAGLGLAIVAEIVAAHGGSVHLDTEVGRGSTFSVRLPIGGSDQTHASARPDSAARDAMTVSGDVEGSPDTRQPAFSVGSVGSDTKVG